MHVFDETTGLDLWSAEARPGPPAGGEWREDGLLAALRTEGAGGLTRLRFRANRSTIWSVTGEGTRLNLHAEYRRAPWSVVRHFAVIARYARAPWSGGRADYVRAARAVRSWPGLEAGLRRARSSARERARRSVRARPARPARPGPCCASVEELRSLRELYQRFNHERFQGRLPRGLHLRLSGRMTSRLGHMLGHTRRGRRYVVEIALSARLMRHGDEADRLDTLLHEMAHAADWLFHGGRGHGPRWKEWARRVGCVPRACSGRRPLGPARPTRGREGEPPHAPPPVPR